MTGSGEVVKRRVKEGAGEFPADCPIEDCAVSVHWRIFPAQGQACLPSCMQHGNGLLWSKRPSKFQASWRTIRQARHAS